MPNILLVETTRCPDGLVFANSPEGIQPAGEYLKPKSERRSVHVVRHDPIRPLVQDFVNARNSQQMSDLFEANGIPEFPDNLYWPRYALLVQQDMYKDLISDIRNGEAELVAEFVSSRFAAPNRLQLIPEIDFSGGSPSMVLRASGLFPFMFMEVLMMAAGNVRLMSCKQCHDFFVTGSGTGRTERAEYCSARCRVAASRVRKSIECVEV